MSSLTPIAKFYRNKAYLKNGLYETLWLTRPSEPCVQYTSKAKLGKIGPMKKYAPKKKLIHPVE